MRFSAYLQLVRPANVITAIADILAGVAVATFSFPDQPLRPADVLLLCLSTAGLYAGGIVFNNVFDAELDAAERPERAIPSGRISKKNAICFGGLLLALGVGTAFAVGPVSGLIASAVAGCALLYDKFGKHHAVLGPLNMGLCRGGNLLLGVSLIPAALPLWGWAGLLPVGYIAAITLISRGEVHGGSKPTLYLAAGLYGLVGACQLFIACRLGHLGLATGLVLLHQVMIFRPLRVAIASPTGPHIGQAVRAGVLSLIVMDAAWVSVSGHLWAALAVLLLLPLSLKLAKVFAVT